MTQIFLIRHAEAEGNLYRRFHGWYDSLITENGYRQIEALAERFRDTHFDAVYSSDLFRTKETAAAIYKTHGLPLNTRKDLREIHVGPWEDLAWGELENHWAKGLKLFGRSSPYFQPDDGETFAQVQDRMENALVEIAMAHPDQTVAIVSHGTAIRCLQGRLRGLGPGQMDGLGHSDNTGVTYIRINNGCLEVVYENDNSHLTDDISTLARQKWWRSKEGKAKDANFWYRDAEPDESFAEKTVRAALCELTGSDAGVGDVFSSFASSHMICAMLRKVPGGLLILDEDAGADKGIGEIPVLYMLPEHRRSDLGIQLLGQAVSVYRAKGRDRLHMYCPCSSEASAAFCKKYGFRKIGEEVRFGVKLEVMEKYIGYEHP